MTGNKRRANFTFTAVDSVPTSFQCRLAGNASGGVVFGARALGAWEPCPSPQASSPCRALPHGRWCHAVPSRPAAQGADEARCFGNWRRLGMSPIRDAKDRGSWVSLRGALVGQVYDSLSSGNWTFSVRAADAAGNLEPSPKNLSWSLALGSYAQISAPPPAMVQA